MRQSAKEVMLANPAVQLFGSDRREAAVLAAESTREHKTPPYSTLSDPFQSLPQKYPRP